MRSMNIYVPTGTDGLHSPGRNTIAGLRTQSKLWMFQPMQSQRLGAPRVVPGARDLDPIDSVRTYVPM